MAARVSIRSLVAAYLAERRPARIDRAAFDALRSWLVPQLPAGRRVSAAYLLELLHETPLEIDRVLGGVPPDLRGRARAADPALCAASLEELAAEYKAARERGDAVRAEDVRRAVRREKDRLRLVLARLDPASAKAAEKRELLSWFLVWLENPVVFPAWLAARLATAEAPPQVRPSGADIIDDC